MDSPRQQWSISLCQPHSTTPHPSRVGVPTPLPDALGCRPSTAGGQGATLSMFPLVPLTCEPTCTQASDPGISRSTLTSADTSRPSRSSVHFPDFLWSGSPWLAHGSPLHGDWFPNPTRLLLGAFGLPAHPMSHSPLPHPGTGPFPASRRLPTWSSHFAALATRPSPSRPLFPSSRLYNPPGRQQPCGAGTLDPPPSGDRFVRLARVAPFPPPPLPPVPHPRPSPLGCCAAPSYPSSRVYTPPGRQQPCGAGPLDPHPSRDRFLRLARVAPFPPPPLFPCASHAGLIPWAVVRPHPIPHPVSLPERAASNPVARAHWILIHPGTVLCAWHGSLSSCSRPSLLCRLPCCPSPLGPSCGPSHTPFSVPSPCGAVGCRSRFFFSPSLFCVVLSSLHARTTTLHRHLSRFRSLLSSCPTAILRRGPRQSPAMPGGRPSLATQPFSLRCCTLIFFLSSPPPPPLCLLPALLVLFSCSVCSPLVVPAPWLYPARFHAPQGFCASFRPVGRPERPLQIPLRGDSPIVLPRRPPLHQFPDGRAGRRYSSMRVISMVFLSEGHCVPLCPCWPPVPPTSRALPPLRVLPVCPPVLLLLFFLVSPCSRSVLPLSRSPAPPHSPVFPPILLLAVDPACTSALPV